MSYDSILLGKYGNEPFSAGVEDLGDDVKASLTVLLGGFDIIEREFTRPANTTAYAAKDCLADNSPSITTQVLEDVARKVGGSGTIVRAVMKTDNPAWTNGISVVVYRQAPGAFISDNAAFDRLYVDKAKAIGQIDFASFQTVTGGAGSFAWCALEGMNMPFKCDAALADLYFQCYIPSGTPTPTSGQKFYLSFGVLKD